jgi:hypothetical protein
MCTNYAGGRLEHVDQRSGLKVSANRAGTNMTQRYRFAPDLSKPLALAFKNSVVIDARD